MVPFPCGVLPVSPWWLLLSHPLPFGVCYGVAWLIGGRRYSRNWFERNAEGER